MKAKAKAFHPALTYWAVRTTWSEKDFNVSLAAKRLFITPL